MKAKKMTLELKKLTSAIKLWQLACAGLVASQIAAPAAYAGPKGGVVVGGDGTIDTRDLTTIIDQKTDLLAIDWDSFNLSEEELVKFLQPDSSSIVLNRILDQSPSEIRGAIEANGNVILVNPRGVLFTETAAVNVGAITAAGLDMDPNDFMSGNFAFKGEGGSAGYVVNRGVINASSAALVGKQVTNATTGLISADLVSLAAADEAVLTFDADGLIGIKITKEVMENELGVDSAVLNQGTLDGKQVLMEAKVSGDLFTSAVNNEGAVRARGIDTSGGKVRLFGSGSSVVNSGELNVSGTSGGEVAIEGDSAIHSGRISARGVNGGGGRVQVLGDGVAVSGNIDACGTAGGGEVLIGGDYQGKNSEVRNAGTTTVTAEADIDASGIGNSDGGRVIVWADESTHFAGSIRAESGELGGDGGFVETSGKVNLHLGEDTMFVSTLSFGNGQTGEWLLDPEWLDIAAECNFNCVSAGSLVGALASNNVTVTVTAANNASVDGESVANDGNQNYSDGIRVFDDLIWDAATELTLNSFNNIQIVDGKSITASSGTLSMVAGGSFSSGGNIEVNNFSLTVGTNGTDTINTLGGITVAGAGSITGGVGGDSFTLSSANDNLTINGDNSFTLSGNISFNAVETLDTGAGSDTVTGLDGADWTLTGNNNEASNNGITFSNVETLIAVNSGLVGTAADESYSLEDNGDVVIYGLTAQSLTHVDAGGGSDTISLVTSTAATLNGVDGEAAIRSIDFSNIEVVSNGTLQASDAGDRYVVTGTDSIEANAIAFSGISSVTAGSGSDTVTGLDGADWTLTGNNNEAENNGITFANVETLAAVNGNLVGTSSSESYSLEDDGDVVVSGLTVQSLTGVDAGDGSDTISLVTSTSAALNGVDGEATIRSIGFSNIEVVSNGTLQASDAGDRFEVTGADSIKANAIAFSGISSVTAGAGSDTVTGFDGANWILTGNANEAENNGITFANVETLIAVNSGLVGTAASESFVLTALGDVEVNSMSFSGLDFVDGGDEADNLDASAYAEDLTLTGTDKQVDAGGLLFSNIESAVVSTTSTSLVGSDAGNQFTIVATNELDVAEISFSGLSTVIAGSGSDLLLGTSAADTFILNGSSGNVTSYGIEFSNLEIVNAGNDTGDILNATGAILALTSNEKEVIFDGSLTFNGVDIAMAGTLEGTSGDDLFEITGSNALNSNQISFSNLATIEAGAGENDTVIVDIADPTSSTVNGNKKIKLEGMDFWGLEFVSASQINLSDPGDNLLEITGSKTVKIDGTNYLGVTAIDAGDGTDTVTGYDSADWIITGSGQAENHDISFSSVEILNAVNAGLIAAAGYDGFTLVEGDGLAVDINIALAGLLVKGASWVQASGGAGTLDAGILTGGVSLTANDNEVDTGDILFSGITSVSASTVTGTDSSTAYVAGASAGSLTVSGIDFTDLSAVTAGAGAADTLAFNSAVTLSADGEGFSSNGIVYSGIESADASALVSIVGSDNDETYNIVSGNTLDITLSGGDTVQFSNVSTVEAGTGDYDTVAAIGDVTLDGGDGAANTGNIDFSNIDQVSGGNLVASDSGDRYVVTGADSIEANGIDFSGISSVAAGSGSDTVTGLDGADWTLTGSNNEAVNNGITFANVETLIAVNGGLIGTSSSESYSLEDDGDVVIYGLTAQSLTDVDAGDGSDTISLVTSTSAALNGVDGEATIRSIDFSNIEVVSNGTLQASNVGDRFEVTGADSIKANAIAFSGISSVTAGSGSDTVTGFDGADWTLTGNNNEAVNNGITFANVETLTAVNGDLIGSLSSESYTLEDDGDVVVSGLTVQSLSGVDAGDGPDIISLVTSTNAVLNGVDGEATIRGIGFSNIEVISNGTLQASDAGDRYVVTGTDSIEANAIAFSGVTSVAAGSGSDTVTGLDGADWTLTGSNNEAENNGITFANVETLIAVSGGLIGTSSSESYSLEDDGDVVIYGLTAQSLTNVDAGGGSDTISLVTSTSAALNGIDGEATIRGIGFSNIEVVSNGTLQASDAGDRYVVTGTDSIEANAIAFSGISSVTAGSGSDTVTGLDGADWTLTGNNNEAENNGITFANVETLAAVNGNLVGTSSSESYSLEDDGDVVVSGLTVQSLTNVDAGDGSDTISLVTSAAATLNGVDGEATIRGIDFSNIEVVSNGTLQASDAGDRYVVTGTDSIEANAIAFSGVTSVAAGSGSDTVTGLDGADWTLTGNNNEASNNGITFANVETLAAVNGGLVGTATDESYSLEDDGDVVIYGLTAQSLTNVDAGGGSDTISLVTSTSAALNGVDGEATIRGIGFSNIEVVSNGTLQASDAGDRFEVTGADSIKANAIAFSGISSVTAGAGSDTVTGLDGANWILTGNNNEAENNGITFANVETLTAVNSSLVGTTASESFVLTALGDVEVNSMSLSGLDSVDGVGGDDSLNAGAYAGGLALTGSNNQLDAGSLVFTNIYNATVATLTGTDGADELTLDAANKLTSGSFSFSGVSTIIAGAGSDKMLVSGDGRQFTVTAENALSFDSMDVTGIDRLEYSGSGGNATGASGADWALAGASGEAKNSLITFSGVSTLIADSAGLVGTSAGESYSLEDDGDVVVDGLSFQALTDVDGGDGSDTVALVSTAAAVLSGSDGEAEILGIGFTNIEAVANGTVTASALGDRFEITGTNAVTANGIAFTDITTIDAQGGEDSVTGANGADWTLTGNSLEASSSGISFAGVELVTAGDAGLHGSSSAESFALRDGGELEVSDITFSELTFVDAGAASDTLDTAGYSGELALNGNSKQLDAGGLLFSNIETVLAGSLLGSSGNDDFVVASDASVSVANMTFIGLSDVNASDGWDTIDASDEISLPGNSGNAEVLGISFSSIEGATGTDIGVIATENNDDVEVISDGSILANGITFAGVSSIDLNGGDDTVTGVSGLEWILEGSQQARNNGVSFSNVEFLIAVDTGLVGTDSGDSFSLAADGSIGVWDMTVSGMQWVDGAGGSDFLDASNYADGLALNGIDNELLAGQLLFSGIENAAASALAGSSSADAFVIAGAGELSAALIDFTGLSGVSGGDGGDSVSSSEVEDWSLNDSGTVEHASINFSGVESFSGGSGTLRGYDGGASYGVDGDGVVSVDSISFGGLDSVIAGAGDDSLGAMDTVTLSGIGGAFSSSGISFSGFESMRAADLVGTSADDSFQMTADSAMSIYGLAISGVDTLDAGGGSDTVLGRSGLGYQLNGDGSVLHDGVTFANGEVFEGQGAMLTATGDGESFTMTAADAVQLDASGLSFSGLTSVNAAGGSDTLAALGSVSIDGNNAVSAGDIQFTAVESVTGTGALAATGGADQFAIVAVNQLDSYGIRFEGVDSVVAGSGSDQLAGLDSEDWALSGSDNALSHAGISFTGLDSTSGGNGLLAGSASADQFTITAGNQVMANSITFTGITQVNAGGGTDTAVSADGETWILGAADGNAVAADIDFVDIEAVSGSDVLVDAATNSAGDNFVLDDSGQSLSVRGIDFFSVGSVAAGADTGDSVSSNATDWQLTGTDGELVVNAVTLSGIDQVITANALLSGTANSETFALAGEGALSVAGMAFEGVARVAAGGGSDLLQGTAAADNFELASFGDIGVAGIRFSGLETVGAGGGADTVNSSGANWTSVSSDDALVDGSVQAEVNSITVLFEDLELVNNTGTYVGQDIDSEYTFSSLGTMVVGGTTFAGLNSVTTGSGTDVLHGADIDAQWLVNASQGTISSDGESLVFNGVESIVAGSGADRFTLSGGEFTSIDSGAGNDTVLLAGTSLETLSLGAGNDLLQVDADSRQGMILSGGSGDDQFQFNIAGKTWQISGSGDQVGNFRFSGFEWLDNNTGSLALETDQNFDFVSGGNSSASFNRNGAGILFTGSGMRLGYDGSGDLTITSMGTGTIGGDLQANRADLIVSGNIDIETDVNIIAIHTSGDDIDVAVLAQGDLVIDEINAGRGNITLNNASFGSLTAETFGDTHLTAGTVNLGSELEQWSIIGSAINPLRMDVSELVDITSLSYFEPDFIGGVPAFTGTGNQLQSVAGAQAAQGLKSAVQNAVEDFVQVDPGIFSAVNPYSTGVDAVNTPEMRISGGELLPVAASAAPGGETELPHRPEEFEEDEKPSERERKRTALAPGNAGG